MSFGKWTLFVLFLFNVLTAVSQTIVLEGYVFESGNRGYLNQVKINILNKSGVLITDTTKTNKEGFFKATLPASGEYQVTAAKDVFFSKTATVKATAGEKAFIQIELDRKPGYLFDVTLAENNEYKDSTGTRMKNAVQGARIEIYNNTKKKSELVLNQYKQPNFQFTFEQGNHYTVLIRKQGYFNKRLEAYVNVKGCILCFDGLESVRPGIADNLTNQNSMGTLLANIELKKITVNNGLSLNNIYYEPSSATLGKAALKELDKLIPILRDNPHVAVEIGSHTDARGDATLNLQLSQERAETVVYYLVTKGELEPSRILAKGYGKAKIMNHCKDGVECTEAEHKENRRTTLMVTNFDENNEANQRTLENILREEEMSRMLKEVQNQEVVAYKSEESSPATAASTKILPKQTDKQSTKILPADEPFMSPDKTTIQTKSTAKVTKEAATKITPQKDMAASATKKTMNEAAQTTAKIKPVQEAAQKTITDAISDADAIEEEALNRESTMPAPPVEPIMRNENGQLIKKNGKSTSIKNVPPSKIKPASEGKEKIKPSDINGETEVENPIVVAPTTNYANKTPNVEKKQATAPSKPKAHKILPSNSQNVAQETTAKIGALPQGFTGFSIQVGSATGNLPDSHVIFKHFKEVIVEEKKDGTKAYLVGAFQTYEDCLSYMKTNILPFFPNARTVAFKDGNWF